MAKPKKSQAGSRAAEPVEVLAAEEDQPDQVTEVWAAMPTDARIEVFRRGDTSKELEYCGVFGTEEFSIEKVRDLFGGGEYTAKAKWRKNGKLTYGTQHSFKIAGPAAWASAPRRFGPGGDGPSRETISDTLLAAMLENLKPKESVTNWTGLAAALAPVGVALVAHLGARKDPMEAAVAVAKLVRENAPPAAQQPVESMLAIFREGMQLGKAAAGTGNKEDDQTALLNKGLDVVNTFAEGYKESVRAKITQGGEPAQLGRPWVNAVYPHRERIQSLAGFLTPENAAAGIVGQFPDEALFDLLDDYESGTPAEFGQRAGKLLGLDDKQTAWLLGVVVQLQTMALDPEGDEEKPADGPPPKKGIKIEKGK